MTGRPVVAFDVTPLAGFRTGIGNAVASTYEAITAPEHDLTTVPFALGLRTPRFASALPHDTRFLRVPTRALLQTWTRTDHPALDRWLRPANMLHATNYVVPPSRLPTVATVYDTTYARFPKLVTPVVRQFARVLQRAVARGAYLHTGAHSVAAELEELYGPGLLAAGRIVVVPFGIPPLGGSEPLPPALSQRIGTARFALALGTIEPRKQLPFLVHAFAEVADTVTDARLVIAGPDGHDRPALDDAIARLPREVSTRVIVLGAVTHAERRALLGAARVLAYPSRYEGFGFPVLEAMAVGTPVVATATGSLPEVAGDAARLVPLDDRDALAIALTEVLTDDAAATALRTLGLAHAEEFTWDRTARGLVGLYRRLL